MKTEGKVSLREGVFSGGILSFCVSAPQMSSEAGINQEKDFPQIYSCTTTVMKMPSPSDGKEESCHRSDEAAVGSSISWALTPDCLKAARWNQHRATVMD